MEPECKQSTYAGLATMSDNWQNWIRMLEPMPTQYENKCTMCVCIKCKHCLVRWVMDESKDEYHVTWTNIELAWPCRVQRRIPVRLRSSQVNVLPVGVNENSACKCEKWPLKFVLIFKGGCSIIYVVGSFHGGVIRIKFPYIHTRLE